ncbi:alpha-E domain-containing protein [Gordonia sp. PDNC005]|uniref:alpha-E domain-containing protein n=1 Tax=unclassified Gordonia (in: high G+C Gram-positive bacteria) TaxID=2657482 RepID=UPI0019650DCA|nr:alpha-E domain-containing protein [Gordonia sp. PDNC005]QRY63134.1 alpha-E domain-containing protein [Gordonia sp. PDNC005]
MMLSRNAESLYWIGRYTERADDMSRILDVAVHQLLEDPTIDVAAAVEHVTTVLGFTPELDRHRTVWSLTEQVAYDRSDPRSIVGLIGAARENARGAREVISGEMWECLNATYNDLGDAELRARRLGPHEFLSYIKARTAMFAGLTDATLSHDDGYSYLLVGRSVERVDMIVRMLHARSGGAGGAPSWMSVLIAAGAQDTFIRTHRGSLDAERVVEFILLDRLFPRSVFHALRSAELNLAALDRTPDRVGAQSRALTLLGRARSSLEFVDASTLTADLSTHLSLLQDTCRAVSESISAEHFHPAPFVSWTDASLSLEVR